MAEARGEPRQARLVGQPLRARRGESGGDQIERLVPRHRHEAGILVAALLRVRALHRLQHAVRVVGLLHQPVSLHAHAPARRMHVLGGEVRLDFGRDAVDDFHRHEVRAGDAVIAVARDFGDRLRLGGKRHGVPHLNECVAGANTRCGARRVQTRSM